MSFLLDIDSSIAPDVTSQIMASHLGTSCLYRGISFTRHTEKHTLDLISVFRKEGQESLPASGVIPPRELDFNLTASVLEDIEKAEKDADV